MGTHKRPGSAAGSPAPPRAAKAAGKVTKSGSSSRSSARRCGFPECGKTAKPGGFCISHGGGKKCAVDGCTTSVVSRGFCVAHGGGKRCQHPDCSKSAQTGGFCWIHGGGKKCGFEGCTKRAQSGGACISHGGGKRCRIDGCNKVVQYEGLCVSHGGYRRCLSINCTRKALANSYCQLHGGNSHCVVANCGKKAVRGGTCGEHKLMAARSAQQQYQQKQQQPQYRTALRQHQSSDEEEAAAAVSVDVRVAGGASKRRHLSPSVAQMVSQQKTPELRAAADAFLAAATGQRPDLTSSPLAFRNPLDERRASPLKHEIKREAGSPPGVVPPFRDSLTATATTISPTVALQSRFSLYAQVSTDPETRTFTPPPSSASTTAAATVALSQLKPGLLPGIQSLQHGLRGRLYSSPSSLPSHNVWSRNSSPFREQQQSLSPPALIAVGSDGHLRCTVGSCGRFAKRSGLCLLHGVAADSD